MAKKIPCDEDCDRCGKPAEYNVQDNSYHEEYVWKRGTWKKVNSDFNDSNENNFFCKECYKKEMM